MSGFLLTNLQSVGISGILLRLAGASPSSLAVREADESTASNLQLPASFLLATAPKRGRSSHRASDLPECRPASLGTPAPHSTGATVVTGCAGGPLSAPVEIFTRPADLGGSGDEPSTPSFADGGAKMRCACPAPAGRADAKSACNIAQAEQVATHSPRGRLIAIFEAMLHGASPKVEA